MHARDPSPDLGTDQKDINLLPWWIGGSFIILIISCVIHVLYGHRHDRTLLGQSLGIVVSSNYADNA